MSRIAFAAAAVALFSLVAVADEPGWTDAQRAEKSTAVLVGTVVSVERVTELNPREDLYRAVVAIEQVTKGDAAVGRTEERVALYFEYPKDGQLSARCPDYVSLKADQRATFYVRLRNVETEWRAFVEMGSDVREPPAKAPGA